MVTQLIFSWNNPVSVSDLSFQKQTFALLDRDNSKYCSSVLLPDCNAIFCIKVAGKSLSGG